MVVTTTTLVPGITGLGTGISETQSFETGGGGGSGSGVPFGQLNPEDYGVVGNGTTDDTEALIAFFTACNDAGLTATMGAGRTYLVTSVFTITLYVPFYGNGSVFLIPNDGQSTASFNIRPIPTDLTTITLGTVNGWSESLYQGSGRIPEITVGGVCICIISTDSVFIGRSAPIGTGVPIGESFIVLDNFNNLPAFGNTSPTETPTTTGFLNGVIRENWAPLLPLTQVTATQEVIKPQLRIDGLAVKYIAGNSSTASTNKAIICTRSNTYFSNCQIQCISGYIQQGFVDGNCGQVTYENCRVQGIGVNATNYGFNFNYACYRTLINCSTNGCRRGLDGTGANYVKIIGGNYPDGIGAHWGRSFYVNNATISASNNSNPRCVMFSGSDVIFEDCDFYAGYIPAFSANVGDTIDILRMREDLPELSGIAAIRGGRIVLDNTGALTGRNVPLFNVMNFGTINAQNTGRTVYLPDRIECKPDQIVQLGADSISTINLIAIGARLTAADFPQDISSQGTFEVDVGAFDLATGYFRSDGITPFLQINLFKGVTSIGPTGTGYVKNCEAISLFCPIQGTDAATSVGRWDIVADNIGYLNINHYDYVLRQTNMRLVPIGLVGSLQDAAFLVTSVGDETWNYDPASTSLDQTAGPGSTQAIGQAYAIAAGATQFITVSANRSCRLPPSIGFSYYIWNFGANALRVYPWFGAQIDALGVNTFYNLPISTGVMFRAVSLTQWYSAAI